MDKKVLQHWAQVSMSKSFFLSQARG